MDAVGFADALTQDFENCFASRIDLLPKRADLAAIPTALNPILREKLNEVGIDLLYSHQAEAFASAHLGKDLVVVTGTNSGKTLCYNLPVLHRLIEEPMAHAIYLFPTKALAQDQLGKIEELTTGLGIRSATYDGDTSPSQRGMIRKNAQIVLSNPDMLHIGILPQYESWLKFLRSLKFIVIDELHAYRGVFGSHVAGILRRLLRLCEWQGSRPQLIGCSATVADPLNQFKSLTGRDALAIDQDGSPSGRRCTLCFSPPLGGSESTSPNRLTSQILGDLIEAEFKCLAFCRTRLGAEVVLRQSREVLVDRSIDPERVESYRAGYSPAERRSIEQRLFKGELSALTTTNAMELGVDVGGLDAVIINGYPGTLSSFRQQAGRAGRGERPGLTVFIAREDPLEQFLVTHPQELVSGAVEHVALNPANPQILSQQLLCAAYERPLSHADLEFFGDQTGALAQSLAESGELHFRTDRYYYPSHEAPAPKIDIRSMSGPTLTLRSGKEVLGTSEYWRALRTLHEGAVYLHRGRTFVSTALNLEDKEVLLQEEETDAYTRTVQRAFVEPRFEIARQEQDVCTVELLALTSTISVKGYQRINFETGERSELFELKLPELSYNTIGVRLSLSIDPDQAVESAFVPALHALEHAIIAVAPILAGCDRNDLGSTWFQVDASTLQPSIYVFDAVPGGIGLSEKLFGALHQWVSMAQALLEGCPCPEGCPKCLFLASCELNNELLEKEGALQLLRAIVQAECVV